MAKKSIVMEWRVINIFCKDFDNFLKFYRILKNFPPILNYIVYCYLVINYIV